MSDTKAVAQAGAPVLTFPDVTGGDLEVPIGLSSCRTDFGQTHYMVRFADERVILRWTITADGVIRWPRASHGNAWIALPQVGPDEGEE